MFHPTGTRGVHPSEPSPLTQQFRLPTVPALLSSLQLLSPATGAAFRALLRVRIRWPSAVFPPTWTAPVLSWASTLQGFLLSRRGTVFTAPPLSRPPFPAELLPRFPSAGLPCIPFVGVANHPTLVMQLPSRVSTNEKSGLSLSRTASPPGLSGPFNSAPRKKLRRVGPGRSR